VHTPSLCEAAIWQVLATVPDPEVPVLSVLDLGVVREVKVSEDAVEIVITPTYTGCPAMDMIATNIKMALLENGYHNIKISTVLAPAWTTEWMTSEGKEKLKAYGIAPPHHAKDGSDTVIACPQCGSVHTTLLSQFGSTACKALYQCRDCREPFDYFKCH